MLNLLSRPRLPFALIALACTGLLAFAYYLQFVEHQEPCPMCIIQRYFFILVCLLATIGCMHGSAGVARKIYIAALGLAALGGGSVALRQVWLQHLPPDQVPECGPGLNFMLEIYPWHEAIAKAFKGTGECAAVNWTFLRLSIAEWSLACFAALSVLAAAMFLARRP